ncbi:S4 domain-containing protein YaaA [Lactiplantibacillus plantarum]|uniref:S4 domain-containing protein YaaA n=1 Tax=Lactiplantibacillus plantarum TaxID=1590 RepID=UPI00217DE425|nr:S4 domain-containing protein YaaA [Lactiplantibacillus plantarum]MCS6156088.1 S4 domain-containing protein YaaA [Lactiplantibacillus plantarum]
MKQSIDIKTPYMTLGQLLKETAIIGSGGQAKWFLKETTVLVNGEPDDRRGRKLYPGDTIEVEDNGSFFIRSNQETTD